MLDLPSGRRRNMSGDEYGSERRAGDSPTLVIRGLMTAQTTRSAWDKSVADPLEQKGAVNSE